MEFYSLNKILSLDCQYNIIIGERSNGKTFAALQYGLQQYIENGAEMAYIRRWKEDMRGNRGERLFKNLEAEGLVSQLTNGEYDKIVYSASRWYLGKWDAELGKSVRSEDPFCYGFSLSEAEHDKSTSYPFVRNVIFDEFLTRQYYLPNEFVLLMNVLSTIIRHRDDVKIFMLANTVNKYAPYFAEMGLGKVAEMEPGKIDVYTYGNSGLKVAVERCGNLNKDGKKSDKYFAFDNPSLEMITGGAWEIDLHPHLNVKYNKSDIIFMYFIEFNDQLLQCEVISKDGCSFTYIHRKSTPLQQPDKDVIYSEKYDERPNWLRNIRKPGTKMEQMIYRYFKIDKVFYQDNEVGEVVRNYLLYCAKSI